MHAWLVGSVCHLVRDPDNAFQCLLHAQSRFRASTSLDLLCRLRLSASSVSPLTCRLKSTATQPRGGDCICWQGRKAGRCHVYESGCWGVCKDGRRTPQQHHSKCRIF